MARSVRKKRFRICFELSLPGFFGISMVVFCVLLWMFLLGIWTGRTVLIPEVNRIPDSRAVLVDWWQKEGEEAAKLTPAEDPVVGSHLPVAPGSGYAVPSFFSLQIAAYADAARAGQAAADWRRRGVEAFLLEPEESGNGLFRVCVGKFDDLADANREAARLEEAEGIRPFITLVAAAKARAS